MHRDNVTPFRRRPEPRRPARFELKDPRALTKLVYTLSIGAFALLALFGGMIGLIGVALAVATVAICAVNRAEGPGWARTHFEFVLRTVVIAGCASLLLSAASFLPGISLLVFPGRLMLMLWVIVRSLVGLFYALRVKAYPRPIALFV